MLATIADQVMLLGDGAASLNNDDGEAFFL